MNREEFIQKAKIHLFNHDHSTGKSAIELILDLLEAEGVATWTPTLPRVVEDYDGDIWVRVDGHDHRYSCVTDGTAYERETYDDLEEKWGPLTPLLPKEKL